MKRNEDKSTGTNSHEQEGAEINKNKQTWVGNNTHEQKRTEMDRNEQKRINRTEQT